MAMAYFIVTLIKKTEHIHIFSLLTRYIVYCCTHHGELIHFLFISTLLFKLFLII